MIFLRAVPLTFGYFWLNYLRAYGLASASSPSLVALFMPNISRCFSQRPLLPFGSPTIFDLSRRCLKTARVFWRCSHYATKLPFSFPYPFHAHRQLLRVHLHFVGGATASWPRNAYSSAAKRGPTQLAQLKINLADCLSVKCGAKLEFWLRFSVSSSSLESGSVLFGFGFALSSPISKGIFWLIYMQRLRQITGQKRQQT